MSDGEQTGIDTTDNASVRPRPQLRQRQVSFSPATADDTGENFSDIIEKLSPKKKLVRRESFSAGKHHEQVTRESFKAGKHENDNNINNNITDDKVIFKLFYLGIFSSIMCI